MKTFLVPIDFSSTSENAAKYAIDLTKNMPGVEIILYHVYSSISFATLTDRDEGSRKKITDAELTTLGNKLNPSNNQTIKVESEEGFFVDSISKYVLSNHIDMVIM